MPTCPPGYSCNFVMTSDAITINGQQTWLYITVIVALVIVTVSVLMLIHDRLGR